MGGLCAEQAAESWLQMLGREGATRAAGLRAGACPKGSQKGQQLQTAMLVTVDGEVHPTELAWRL